MREGANKPLVRFGNSFMAGEATGSPMHLGAPEKETVRTWKTLCASSRGPCTRRRGGEGTERRRRRRSDPGARGRVAEVEAVVPEGQEEEAVAGSVDGEATAA